jgi:hypothetical protein
MAALDLRPLSLGEILDRSFSLYRENFLLFVGIVAIPNLLTLAFQLLNLTLTGTTHTRSSGLSAATGVGVLAVLLGGLISFVAYLYSHGATIFAVSDLYLGQTATIGGSLRKMRGHAANLFGVLFLEGLAMIAGFILLIFPGIYVTCRLCTSAPAAILEQLGPSESLSRSFELTRDSALRAFAIFCIYMAIFYAIFLLLSGPFLFLITTAGRGGNPAMVIVWLVCSQIASFVATTVVEPVLTIATTVFYYDLRVRKEGFDLQMLVNAVPVAPLAPATGLPPAPIS